MPKQVALSLSPFLLATGLFLNPVFAQESMSFHPPQGIAISQAAEAAVGICLGSDPAQTIACAQKDCMEQTGYDAIDCPVTDWCYDAGWTIDVFVQHTQGPHWHEYSCGWPTREQAEAAAKLICRPDFIMGCMPVLLWTPQGEKIDVF